MPYINKGGLRKMQEIQKVYNEGHAISKAQAIGALFISKEKRDLLAAKLKQEGYSVKNSSCRGQQIPPEYIEDYEGVIETGFGNSQYTTFFSVLYNLRVI